MTTPINLQLEALEVRKRLDALEGKAKETDTELMDRVAALEGQEVPVDAELTARVKAIEYEIGQMKNALEPVKQAYVTRTPSSLLPKE
jgi:hypothetical protein